MLIDRQNLNSLMRQLEVIHSNWIMDIISVHDLNEIIKANTDVIVIDVRNPLEHKAGTIPGSQNIPLEEIERFISVLKKYSSIYVTCSSGGRSSRAYGLLKKHKLPVVNVEGGVTAWRNAGFEIAQNIQVKARIPIMRQTFLIAGLLVLIGHILGYFISSYFILIPLLVGGGLVFAGITGYCGMKKFIQWMPWNK